MFNFEFKARCKDPSIPEKLLSACNPRFIGTDHQIDTYFKVPNGRMKLREGNIENALIHYSRNNTKEAKQSEIILYQHNPESKLKEVLTRALGILVTVDKLRKIYFIENVKFHFDIVKGLGNFIEVEAIDRDGTIGLQKLREQCNGYAQLLEITIEDYIAESYSDLLMEKNSSTS